MGLLKKYFKYVFPEVNDQTRLMYEGEIGGKKTLFEHSGTDVYYWFQEGFYYNKENNWLVEKESARDKYNIKKRFKDKISEQSKIEKPEIILYSQPNQQTKPEFKKGILDIIETQTQKSEQTHIEPATLSLIDCVLIRVLREFDLSHKEKDNIIKRFNNVNIPEEAAQLYIKIKEELKNNQK